MVKHGVQSTQYAARQLRAREHLCKNSRKLSNCGDCHGLRLRLRKCHSVWSEHLWRGHRVRRAGGFIPAGAAASVSGRGRARMSIYGSDRSNLRDRAAIHRGLPFGPGAPSADIYCVEGPASAQLSIYGPSRLEIAPTAARNRGGADLRAR